MNRNSDAFKGGNFCWFTGVVEDINDSEKLGRVRVRAFGYHTESLVDIKTDALPWATVMGPTNSANISGIGTTTHGLVNGSWVVGFFRDGPSAQDPIIMGTVGSTYEEKPKNKTGFSDPSETYPKLQGTESTYVDTNLLARGTNTITRELDTVTEEPATKYAAVYPNNKVTQTTSGHIIEIDDTPGAERINVRHRSGTFVEIHPNGDVVQNNGNRFQITTGNDNVHITGVCNLTIDQDCNTTILGDWNIDVTGNKNETIGGNVTEDVGGSVNETVAGSVTETYTGSQTTKAASMDIDATSGDIDMDSSGDILLN
jgi:hypothetical protein